MTAPWHLTAAEMDAEWDALRQRVAVAEAQTANVEGLYVLACNDRDALRQRVAEAEAREARAVCLRCGSPMGVVGGVPTTNTDLYDGGRISADSASGEGEK